MVATLAIALAAGFAAALMFVSIISQTLVSVALVSLAPLPLMAAALGWGPLAALFGSLIAAAALSVINPSLAIAFALSVAAPACWLSHLALLAKPAEGGAAASQSSSLEWYPPGRLLMWIALCACAMAASFVFAISDEASINDLRANFTAAMAKSGMKIEDPERAFASILRMMPPLITSATLVMLTLNMWGAAKVVALSGRLRRPWPDLRMIVLPSAAMFVVAAALALSFAGGVISQLALVVAGALLTAYGFTGLAVLHVATQNSNTRVIWLMSAYASVLLLFWPFLIFAMLGLADAVVGLRQRIIVGRPPALPPNT